MSNSSPGIAQKYTKSILNTTGSISVLEESISEMRLICETLSHFTDLWCYLCNQWIPSQEKVFTFNRISHILKLSQVTIAVMSLIIHNHRLCLIHDIITQLELELCSMRKTIQVTIKTALALDKATSSSIKDNLNNVFNLDTIPSFAVDPSLIGGFIVYGDSVMIDLSFKGRINQLKKVFNLK